MKPKIDFAFKEIMMNEKARKGFLAAVLHLNPDDIRETRILNTYLRKQHKDDKQGILDVRILLNDDTQIDVEIQVIKLAVWADRSLFYVAKMFVEQIKPGQTYDVLKKCVNISILDFELIPDDPEFYSCFHLREDTRHTLYTDKIEFHVIELPKLPEKLRDGDSVLLWAKFINAERKEEFDMLAEQDEYIRSAYEQLQLISQDKRKRRKYEERQKAILDYNQGMKEAHEEGIAKGINQGISIGEKQKAIAIAKNFIAIGLDYSTIVQGTGLTLEEVEALANGSDLPQ